MTPHHELIAGKLRYMRRASSVSPFFYYFNV